MTALLVASASAWSGLVLGWFAWVNAKRRRAHGLARVPAPGPALRYLMLLLGLLPGAVLVALGNPAAFVIWLGAVTLVGWRVAARRPAAGVSRGTAAGALGDDRARGGT